MKRIVLVLCLTAAGVFGQARQASAIWSWLEEFSGPGPFHGPSFLFTVCWPSGQGKVPKPSPLVNPNGTQPNQAAPCIYLDQGFFSADADKSRGFPDAIDARLTDIGGSVRIMNGLDIGSGVGWITFKSRGETRGSKFTITPIRVVTRPLLLALPPNLVKGGWQRVGALSVYWKEVFVKGPLTGDDFGLSGTAFSSNSEIVRSFGITLDVSSLIFGGRWDFKSE